MSIKEKIFHIVLGVGLVVGVASDITDRTTGSVKTVSDVGVERIVKGVPLSGYWDIISKYRVTFDDGTQREIKIKDYYDYPLLKLLGYFSDDYKPHNPTRGDRYLIGGRSQRILKRVK